ncbi:MAG: ATP-binding protein [Bryobacteraceae bacterium]
MMVTMPLPNLFLDDLTLCEPVELRQAIINLAQSGVEEKFRLDFKERWEADKQCPDIVAFANSYGGLLVLGVTDDRQGFPGIPVPPKSDLKTQLASVIATRISPVPVFEVHTCPSPNNAGYALALIRVSPQPKIHMYLKGEKPVYIRNDDQSVPARATDLQALLDRVRSAEKSDQEVIYQSRDIARRFYVTKANDLSATFAERQYAKNRHRSNTYCRIEAVPERSMRVGLDSVLEQRFVRTIYQSYPSIARRSSEDRGSRIVEREDRAGSWYRYHHLDLERDHEAVWALNKDGIIQFICECAGRIGNAPADLWSLVDLFINLDGSLRLAHEMWTMLGYFGDSQFLVELSVPKLVAHTVETHYPSLFYGVNFGFELSVARKVTGDYEVTSGRGEAVLGYDARTSQRPASLAILGNQVLRDLGIGVDVTALRDALGHLPPP